MTLHLYSCEYAYGHGQALSDHASVGCPLGTRLHRVVRVNPEVWRLWVATNDYVLGTYLELHSSGEIVRVTARSDEGDEVYLVRPSDQEIITHGTPKQRSD